MIDINRISNETLHKLTWEEIGELDLLNHGVMTYHGELKSRVKGWKRETVSEYQTNFVSPFGLTVEFITTQKTNLGGTEYAYRVREDGKYAEQVNPLGGLKFIK